MAQQTRRAPGRPKKTEAAAAPVVEKKVTKRPPIIRKEQVNDTVEYEVINGGGIVYMLPQQGTTVHDKETDTVRELRYCPNENSVWADEQGPRAMKKSVIFRDGKIL